MNQIFPELAMFFKGNIYFNISYQLLNKYSSPNDIKNIHLIKLIKHTILQIKLYDEQIAKVESLNKQILDEMNTLISNIPGMSYNQASVIIGCIGNINRF